MAWFRTVPRSSWLTGTSHSAFGRGKTAGVRGCDEIPATLDLKTGGALDFTPVARTGSGEVHTGRAVGWWGWDPGCVLTLAAMLAHGCHV